MPNSEIKNRIAKSRLYQYQVATKLGVSECTLIRWLRYEMEDTKKARVMQAIAELEREAG